jgi:hypothetical protein
MASKPFYQRFRRGLPEVVVFGGSDRQGRLRRHGGAQPGRAASHNRSLEELGRSHVVTVFRDRSAGQ